MAVTQQLARVTREHLATCSRSVDVLDRLCSFDGPDEDYLDLDWAPRYITRTLTLSGAPAAEVALLDLAWAVRTKSIRPIGSRSSLSWRRRGRSDPTMFRRREATLVDRDRSLRTRDLG